jgi:formate dehydrogenase subunit gamma
MAPERIRRFSRTERALHWVHASAFFVLLGSGLVLYLPSLSELVARRQLVKDVHLFTGLAWAILIALLLLLGLFHGLGETIRELERFDGDDLRWLLRGGGQPARFNAGQKLNAAVTAAFGVLLAISGFLLWYGERDTGFRLANTLLLHDGLMYVSLVLVAGHLYLSLIHPATRHALRGITYGSVDVKWARRHHPRWARLTNDLHVRAEGIEPERGRTTVSSTRCKTEEADDAGKPGATSVNRRQSLLHLRRRC